MFVKSYLSKHYTRNFSRFSTNRHNMKSPRIGEIQLIDLLYIMKNDTNLGTTTADFYTPESVVHAIITHINAKEIFYRIFQVRGKISQRNAMPNATFATLTGNSGNTSIRVYTSLRDGNQSLLDNIWPDHIYQLSGRLSVYYNNNQLQIQLSPVDIKPVIEDETDTLHNKRLNDVKDMIPSILKRRNDVPGIEKVIQNAIAMGNRIKVALVFPINSEANALEDIKAGLKNVINHFNFEFFQCNFTNVSEISNTLKKADSSLNDMIIFSRGGGQHLNVLDHPTILETLVSLRKPVLAGLGHATNNHWADIIVEKSCNVPYAVGAYLLETYERLHHERETPQQSKTKFPKELSKEYENIHRFINKNPKFYDIKGTDNRYVKFMIFALMLIGLLQIISLFI